MSGVESLLQRFGDFAAANLRFLKPENSKAHNGVAEFSCLLDDWVLEDRSWCKSGEINVGEIDGVNLGEGDLRDGD